MFIDNLVKLKDYVPLLQTFIWILFVIFIIIYFSKYIKNFIEIIIERVKKGSSIKAGSFLEIGEDLKDLEYANQATQAIENNTETERENY